MEDELALALEALLREVERMMDEKSITSWFSIPERRRYAITDARAVLERWRKKKART